MHKNSHFDQVAGWLKSRFEQVGGVQDFEKRAEELVTAAEYDFVNMREEIAAISLEPETFRRAIAK